MRLPRFILRMAASQLGWNQYPWWSTGYQAHSVGKIVTPEIASQLASVYSCVNVLAETLASFPIKVYRKTRGSDGRAEEEEVDPRDLPFVRTLATPNPIDGSFDMFELIMWDLALRGRAFAFKRRVGRDIVALDLIRDPDSVQVRVTESWRYEFTYQGETYTTEQMLYIKTHDGKSILKSQADTVGRGIAIGEYGGSFFKNSAAPNLAIETPNKMDDQAAKRFKETWDLTYRGAENGNKIAILDQGKKLVPINVSNEDAQFLQTARYTKEEICGLFRVSPPLIGDLEHGTFSNIENLGIQFKTFTMVPWCRRIEQALTRQCIWDVSGDRSLHCEFVMDGIERGDIQSRYNAYTQARNAGWMSANEIRKKENLNPIDGGDEYLRPANMQVVGQPLKEDGNE